MGSTWVAGQSVRCTPKRNKLSEEVASAMVQPRQESGPRDEDHRRFCLPDKIRSDNNRVPRATVDLQASIWLKWEDKIVFYEAKNVCG